MLGHLLTIFHGVDTYDYHKTWATTGLSLLIDNRVGLDCQHAG